MGPKKNGNNPAMTTDNAINMVNACRDAEIYIHIGCFAHTLNLCTQRGLKVNQMDRLCGRVRHVVSFFHRSSVATDILKQKQALLELPKHKLIQDLSTRWNSTYDMICLPDTQSSSLRYMQH